MELSGRVSHEIRDFDSNDRPRFVATGPDSKVGFGPWRGGLARFSASIRIVLGVLIFLTFITFTLRFVFGRVQTRAFAVGCGSRVDRVGRIAVVAILISRSTARHHAVRRAERRHWISGVEVRPPEGAWPGPLIKLRSHTRRGGKTRLCPINTKAYLGRR